MRFMMLVKHDEIQAPPPKEFLDAMAKLGEEAEKSGTMIASGGLSPIAKSARVRLSRGQVNALDGPFAEAKEVVGGFAIFELKSKEDAIEGAKRFMELHKKYWPGWGERPKFARCSGPKPSIVKHRSARLLGTSARNILTRNRGIPGLRHRIEDGVMGSHAGYRHT